MGAKMTKQKKGINSLIAVILLITIAVSGGFLIFHLFNDSMSIAQQKTLLTVTHSIIYVSENEPYVLFSATLKNTGSKPFIKISLKLDREEEYLVPTISTAYPLEPGKTVSIHLAPPQIHKEYYNAGHTYCLAVEAKASDGSIFATTISVKCIAS